MMKKVAALCVALLICLTFAACQRNDENDPVGDGDGSLIDNMKGQFLDEREANQALIVRSDAEGLVEIRIEKGKASAQLNAARFETLYNYSGEYGELLFDGRLPIKGLSGKVKDGCVAQVEQIDYLNGTDFVTPTIFLLMEDGSVEWVPVELFSQGYGEPELYSWGPLMWIEGIVSLSYESDGEGMGSMTVFATDKGGIRYDLSIPVNFMELCNGSWICDLNGEAASFDSEGYFGVLTFTPEGGAAFEAGWVDGGDVLRYVGSYELSIAENGKRRPGILSFDLKLEAESHAPDAPKRIRGSYFADVYGIIMLDLWHSDGDFLYAGEYKQLEHGEFWLSYNPFGMESYPYSVYEGERAYGNEQHLLLHVQEADKMVNQYGMSILQTDEYIGIFGDTYQLIWLGTDHPDHFVHELLYAMSDEGKIAQYDPISDRWSIVWTPN